jgi:SRSO17 transposase
VITIDLAFANESGFRTLIDSTLYLPEKTWHLDRARCRAVGIPKEVVYRPYHEIALEQIDRARANHVPLDWIGADERYGGVPAFLAGLEACCLPYAVQVPVSATGWTVCPEVWQSREQAGDRGKGLRKYPHLAVDAPAPKSVEEIARHSYVMRQQPWVAFRVKETQKGPEVWEAKICPFFQNRDGLPSKPLQLLVARHVLDGTIKYFVIDAPPGTPLETLMRVAFMRWNVERCFEDEKGRIGMHHFEVRRYLSVKRHLMVSMVSHLFLAEQHERLRGEKPVPHDLPGPSRHRCAV